VQKKKGYHIPVAEIKTEGIVLKVIPYKDHHRIVHLFTPHEGVLSFLAKGVSKPQLQSLLSPLSHIEVVLRKKTSDLYFFQEGTLLESHHFLRASWPLLEAAGRLGGALLKTQLPGKPAPDLYHLLIACLKQLPRFEEPATLATLFILKLLTYEGVVAWDHPSLFPIPCPNWPTLKELAETRSFRTWYALKDLSETLPDLETLLISLF